MAGSTTLSNLINPYIICIFIKVVFKIVKVFIEHFAIKIPYPDSNKTMFIASIVLKFQHPPVLSFIQPNKTRFFNYSAKQ